MNCSQLDAVALRIKDWEYNRLITPRHDQSWEIPHSSDSERLLSRVEVMGDYVLGPWGNLRAQALASRKETVRRTVEIFEQLFTAAGLEVPSIKGRIVEETPQVLPTKSFTARDIVDELLKGLRAADEGESSDLVSTKGKGVDLGPFAATGRDSEASTRANSVAPSVSGSLVPQVLGAGSAVSAPVQSASGWGLPPAELKPLYKMAPLDDNDLNPYARDVRRRIAAGVRSISGKTNFDMRDRAKAGDTLLFNYTTKYKIKFEDIFRSNLFMRWMFEDSGAALPDNDETFGNRVEYILAGMTASEFNSTMELFRLCLPMFVSASAK